MIKEETSVIKILILFFSLISLPAFAQGILIQEVSNMGITRITTIDRKEHTLFYDGARIDPSLIPLAASAYRAILPKKEKVKRLNARCAAGKYSIKSGSKIEKGCLEDERAVEIAKALAHLKKLIMMTSLTK